MQDTTDKVQSVPEAIFTDGSLKRVREPSMTHNNSELLLWALYTSGGANDWVDVEAVFVCAWRLAPERLSWRTYPEYPDYKKCSKALQELEDEKRSDHLGLVARKDRYTRKLTLAGVDWCRRWESHLGALYANGAVPQVATTANSKLISTARKSELFGRFLVGGASDFALWEMADLLRCQPESKLPIWQERCDALESAARVASDADVEAFAKSLRASVIKMKKG